MKTGSIICLVLFVAAAALTLAQMWFSVLSAEVFTKLLVTLVVLFVVALGITLVKKEYLEEKKMKNSGFID
ncbi:MAG: hypothetical protein ACU84Q_07810 [Gammaproteobacteria bacterium]